MTISEAPLDELNRFACEKLGFKQIPATAKTVPWVIWPDGRRQNSSHLPDLREGDGLKMLLERMVQKVRYWRNIQDRVLLDKVELGRAVVEEFCLSEGWTG